MSQSGAGNLQERIVQSGLVGADDLAQLTSELAASQPEQNAVGADQALLDLLVERGRITDFQARALADGLAGPFQLGPYEVRQRIVAGRLGTVYRARHVEFDQPVSLKVFSRSVVSDAELLARMQREVRVAVEADHPHILRAFQIGRVGNTYYLALEDLQGETLEARLERDGRLPFAEACRLIRQAVLALESLHEAQIVHRDLRPANLWVNLAEQLKLMEFGAARDELAFLDQPASGESLTRADSVLSDYRYTAPEAAKDARQMSPQSDIYSLGCTLYHTLAGQPPFKSKNPLRVVDMHSSEAPPPLDLVVPGIPQRLADIVAGMLAKSPDSRPALEEIDWSLQSLESAGSVAPVSQEQAWNPKYLAWLQEVNAMSSPAVSDEDGSELLEFLAWLRRQ